MTRRLYYDDAHRLEFSSQVLDVHELPDGRWGVVLDATCFYPTSGGQMHDRGELGGATVEDVLDEGDRIVHVVRGGRPPEGGPVLGRVDGVRRAHHRQQHSGQHVLSRVLEDGYGWPTLSSRLGETMNTLEISAPALEPALLEEIEDRTNRAIWEGRPVRVRYLDEAGAARAGLRRKIERDGPLRVVEIEDLDRCPCGGTHVRNTAEIGLVALLGTEKMRGGTRIRFLCGQRAVDWRRERVGWLDRTALGLTTGHELVPETVGQLQQELRESRKRTDALTHDLLLARIERWRASAEVLGGLSVVLRVLDAQDEPAATAGIHAAVEGGGRFAAFVIEGPEKCQVLAASTADADAGAVLKRVLGQFGGRGGGQPGFARGGCRAVDAERVLTAFRAALGGEPQDPR